MSTALSITTDPVIPMPTVTPLADLVGRAQGGDRAAAEALCLRLKDPVFAFCLSKLSRRADAEDICQEVLVAVLAGLDRLARPAAILGYTLAVARNQVNRFHARGPQRREVPLDDPDRLAPPEPAPPPGEPDPRDLRERMEDALGGLVAVEPAEVRALIDLYYRQGRTSAEIARALGLRPSGVRMRLKRIRERLQIRLLALALEQQP